MPGVILLLVLMTVDGETKMAPIPGCVAINGDKLQCLVCLTGVVLHWPMY